MSMRLISGWSAFLANLAICMPALAQPYDCEGKTSTIDVRNPPAAAATLDLQPDERERALEIAGLNP